MNVITKPTYFASITIGKHIGYSTKCYSKEKLIKVLQQFQKKQITERKVYLSTCVSECEIVLSGQIEPHIKLEFINYPKFPLTEKQFKDEVELLAEYLMKELSQNRIVIVFHNETKMLELSGNIDPRISNQI